MSTNLMWFTLDGGCMRPLLHKGEILPVDAIDPNCVSAGDIVLYRVGTKCMLHRVWWQDRRGFWIKDDTGTVSLHRIPRRFILGRLNERFPLNRGWIGLVYSLVNTMVFIAGRAVKQHIPVKV